jgi:putative lipoic acid-binding regulatory protein
MSEQTHEPPRGFQFPGRFEISAMGAADAGLDQLLPTLLEALGLTVDRGSLRQRPSSKGHYVAVAISFEANSRADYDAAHAVLRARPEIKWTL